jgi:hypothetical protein
MIPFLLFPASRVTSNERKKGVHGGRVTTRVRRTALAREMEGKGCKMRTTSKPGSGSTSVSAAVLA